MLLQYILFIFVVIANFVLGGIVLARKYNTLSGGLFGITTFSISLWALGDMLLLGGNSLGVAESGAYLFYIAPMLIPLSLWLFSLIFPEERKLGRLPLLFGTIMFVVVGGAIVADLNWLIADINVTSQPNVVTPRTPGFYVYAIYLALFFMLMYIALFRKSLKVKGRARVQITYVMFGAILASMPALFTNLLLPLTGKKDLIWLGPIFSLVAVTFVMIAMVRHRMFDIRLIVARSLTYILALTVLASGYGAVVFLVTSYAFKLDLSVTARIFISVATAIAALTFPGLKRFFDVATSTIFYRDNYDPQEFIRKLNGVVVATIDLDSLLQRVVKVITENMKSEFCVFALDGTEKLPQRFVGNRQLKLQGNEIIALQQKSLHQNGKPECVFVAEDLAETAPHIYNILKKNDIEVLATLSTSHDSENDSLGYIALGAKKSGNLYTSQDIKIMNIIANELVIAIQNAMHFEEIERFNETLEQKVRTATRKLQKTNEKLVQMDANKDEFISMASHQLRTPLTSMKGYVSMVLEEDAGPLNKQQKQMLGQAFVSSQRMAFLIADLLNISRLRTGKFVIESARVNIAHLIQEEVDQLHDTAVARGLRLVYEKPSDFPLLMLDEMKTRQVIMNFIDNAIYYTRSGGAITVHLTQTEKSIEFKVEDTGIGVPRHEQQHLFTKYFRAGNARQARPDGTGLGLFMAKKVIVAQGGAITFKSAEGKGSVFGFIFPKAKVQIQGAGTENKTPATPSIYEKVTVVK